MCSTVVKWANERFSAPGEVRFYGEAILSCEWHFVSYATPLILKIPIYNLVLLADSMQQASALLADTEEGDAPKTSSSSFLSAAALGDVVSLWVLFDQILCAFSHDHSMSLLSLSLSLRDRMWGYETCEWNEVKTDGAEFFYVLCVYHSSVFELGMTTNCSHHRILTTRHSS